MPALFRRRAFWVAVVIVVAVVGGFVMMKAAASAKKEKAAAAAAQAKARPSPYAAIANGKADVEGGIVQIAARRAGIVREVLVQEGDMVTKGQVLARQDDEAERLAADTAAATLAQAQAAIRLLQVQKATAQRELARLQTLAGSNFVAAQRLDQARDAVSSADAQIAAQQATIQTASAQRNQALYNRELTIIRAPADGRIVRRYANPGSGASTLNVSNMFDLEPAAARIIRAEIAEGSIGDVFVGQQVEITAETDQDHPYVGKVIRRAAVFGARKLQSDDPSERTDERVVEVVVSADNSPFLIGQRVLVKFMKPGFPAGVKRAPAPAAAPRKG